jgi:hypothetical protein
MDDGIAHAVAGADAFQGHGRILWCAGLQTGMETGRLR